MSTQIIQNSSTSVLNRAQLRLTPRRQSRILLAGTGRAAVAAARLIASSATAVICGAIDPKPHGELAENFPEIPWLGSFEGLREHLVSHCIDELHIALPLKSFADRIACLQEIGREVGTAVIVHIDITPWGQARKIVASEERVVIASHVHTSLRGYSRLAKRALDLLVASFALLVLSPLLLLIALAIAITSRGPVLFRQERVGRGQRVFRMLKFRSMVHNAEELRSTIAEMNNARGISFKIFDDPRLTRVGTFLRRSSLDELPQLWNVLRGEMSLVGPRPIPVWVADQLQELKSYRRFSVVPGLTGLWQVEGRQQDFDWMATQDLKYIDNWSLFLDLKILFATIPAMLRGEGAH